MKHLFYIWALVALLWEMYQLSSPKQVSAFRERIRNKKYSELPSNGRTLGTLMLLYVGWCLVGLFSSQWIIFSAVIIISNIPKKTPVATFIDGLIGTALMLFMILNVYHLHIDLPSLFFK